MTNKIEITELENQSRYVEFSDKNNIGKWFKYTTDFPEKNALHLVWFDYGIYCSIEHFNTDESNKLPKDRCLNKLFYNKYLVEVVVRQKNAPHQQVVKWDDHICDSLDSAIDVAIKYINENIEIAREAQIEHLNTFKNLTSLT